MIGPMTTPSTPAAPPASSADFPPPDPEAFDSPRAEIARARGLAAPSIPGGRDPEPEATERRERIYVQLLVAMVVGIVLAGFILGLLSNVLGLGLSE